MASSLVYSKEDLRRRYNIPIWAVFGRCWIMQDVSESHLGVWAVQDKLNSGRLPKAPGFTYWFMHVRTRNTDTDIFWL